MMPSTTIAEAACRIDVLCPKMVQKLPLSLEKGRRDQSIFVISQLSISFYMGSNLSPDVPIDEDRDSNCK
jgi:hypothetical protein